jgi:hypothetical protein
MRKLIALTVAPVIAAGTAAAIVFAPSADAATTLPTGADVEQIVNCTVALVDQLLFSGRPGSDCFGVP